MVHGPAINLAAMGQAPPRYTHSTCARQPSAKPANFFHRARGKATAKTRTRCKERRWQMQQYLGSWRCSDRALTLRDEAFTPARGSTLKNTKRLSRTRDLSIRIAL
jgi:hypothetical protein